MRVPFHAILCPTDLSPLGNSAVPVAYAIASAGSTVHLLHVMSPPEPAAFGHGLAAPHPGPTPEEAAKAEEAVRARLLRMVPPDAVAAGVRTEVHVEHGMPIAAGIEATARELDADAVVMGTHGRTGIGRVLMGSVAAEVLRRKDLSVLLVRDDRAARTSESAEAGTGAARATR